MLKYEVILKYILIDKFFFFFYSYIEDVDVKMIAFSWYYSLIK